MNKRAAELAIQTIIIAVIALVVLIVILLILRGHIGKSSKQYFEIGEQATSELKCKPGLVAYRKCAASCTDPELDSKYFWKSVGVMGCNSTSAKPVCCERGELKSAENK